MKRIISFLVLFISVVFIASGQLVDNSLSDDLIRIFPELSKGYIDLNGNGRLDELDEINERIPESEVKDSIVQVQEILDFLLEYYPYLPLDKILAVQSALQNAEGAIPEIISLSWKNRIEEIVALRRKMGVDTILLTPTALHQAHETMYEYLDTMVLSYKKEGRSDERTFIQARDNLLGMLEKGYPLPDGLEEEQRTILLNTLIHTVGNSTQRPDATVRTSIKTLGKLEAEQAVPYILELMDEEEYKLTCIEALGEIGNDMALEVLKGIAESDPPEKTRNTVIRAIGRIGGRESAELLLGLAQSTGTGDSRATDGVFAEAFSEVAAGGIQDRRIAAVLGKYAESQSADIRKTAVRGLGYFDTQENVQDLLNKLKEESSEEVKIEIIRALNRLHHNAIIPTLLAQLKEEGLSPTLQKEILAALGSNPEGIRASVQILDFLGNKNPEVRTAARKALLSLYQVDRRTIAGILSRGSVASKDNVFLKEATGILAEISDPDTLAALTTLIQNPSAEVKKNVTWALYRIAPKDNLRLAGELAKLVSGETEALEARINAVRALGAMRTDAPNLNIWQTLLTTAKMRGNEYLMLRFYAVQALGDLGVKNTEITETLALLALRESDRELKLQSLRSLRKVIQAGDRAEETLLSAFRQSEAPEIHTCIIEILGDLGSESTVDSAVRAFNNEMDNSKKKRILYALSKVGSKDALNTIVDSAKEPALVEFIVGTLEDADPDILSDLVDDRLKVEDNEDIIPVLEELKTRLEERF